MGGKPSRPLKRRVGVTYGAVVSPLPSTVANRKVGGNQCRPPDLPRLPDGTLANEAAQLILADRGKRPK